MKIRFKFPKLIFLLLTLVLTNNVLNAQTCPYQSTVDSLPLVIDGEVNCFLKHGNKLLLGGSFDCIATPNQGIAAVNSNGQTLTQFRSPVKGKFLTLYEGDGVGGAYAAGHELDHIYHITSTGAVSNWKPKLVSLQSNYPMITAMLNRGGKLFVAGVFDSINGVARKNFAVFSTATGALLPIQIASVEEGITDLVLSGNKLYMAGYFTAFGSNIRNGLASVDTTNWQLTSWNPVTSNSSGLEPIQIVGNNQSLIVVGSFDSIAGQNRSQIAAFDANTGNLKPFNPNIGGYLKSIAIKGDTLFLGGDFSEINSESRFNLGAINLNTGILTSWNPGVVGASLFMNYGITQLAMSNNTIYIAGNFNQIHGENRIRLAAFDIYSGALLPWNPRSVDLPSKITVSGNNLFLGGRVRGTGGILRKNIAAIDTVTLGLLSWNPNATQLTASSINRFNKQAGIKAMILVGDTLFVGGIFDSIGGNKHNGLAAINVITGNVLNWSCDVEENQPFESWNYGEVNVIKVYQNTIFIGGYFSTVGGQSRNRFAAINKANGLVQPLNLNIQTNISNAQEIKTMLVYENTLYIGGAFDNIGGLPRNSLASLNLLNGTITGWNPSPNKLVSDMAIFNNNLVVSGYFETMNLGNSSRKGLAIFDIVTGNLLNKQVDTRVTSAAFDVLYISNNTIFLGGFIQYRLYPLNAKYTGWLQLDTNFNLLNWYSPYEPITPNFFQFDPNGSRVAFVKIGNDLYSSSSIRNGPLFINDIYQIPYGFFKQSLVQPVIRKNVTSQTVCTGVGVKFEFEIDGPEIGYQWYKNNVPISNEMWSEIMIAASTVSANGWYKCIATSSCGTLLSDSGFLTVTGVKPTVNFSINDSNQCLNENQFVFINQSTVNTGSLTYNWDFGNGVSSTKRDTSFSYNTTGTFLVTLTAIQDNGPCNESISKEITVAQSPLAELTTTDPTKICGNGAVRLNAKVDTGWTFNWFKDGTLISSWNDSSNIATASGSYNTIVTTLNGCKDTSNSIFVTINPTPIVTFNLTTDTVFIADGPIVLSNGLPIGGVYSGIGVTDSIFSPINAGLGTHVIQYIYIDSNGCSDSAASNIVVLQSTGLKEVNAAFLIKLHPNPSTDFINISLENEVKDGTLTIMNVLGTVVYEESINQPILTIPISKLSSGTYFISIFNNKGQARVRFVKIDK